MNNLAYLLAYRAEKTAEAMSLINRAIDLAGQVPDLLDTRALIYMKLGTPQRALNDLDNAIQDAPSASLYFHRAQAQRLSDRIGAIASLKKARELKLDRGSLHALEQPAYDDLLKSLDAQ